MSWNGATVESVRVFELLQFLVELEKLDNIAEDGVLIPRRIYSVATREILYPYVKRCLLIFYDAVSIIRSRISFGIFSTT